MFPNKYFHIFKTKQNKYFGDIDFLLNTKTVKQMSLGQIKESFLTRMTPPK